MKRSVKETLKTVAGSFAVRMISIGLIGIGYLLLRPLLIGLPLPVLVVVSITISLISIAYINTFRNAEM